MIHTLYHRTTVMQSCTVHRVWLACILGQQFYDTGSCLLNGMVSLKQASLKSRTFLTYITARNEYALLTHSLTMVNV